MTGSRPSSAAQPAPGAHLLHGECRRGDRRSARAGAGCRRSRPCRAAVGGARAARARWRQALGDDGRARDFASSARSRRCAAAVGVASISRSGRSSCRSGARSRSLCRRRRSTPSGATSRRPIVTLPAPRPASRDPIGTEGFIVALRLAPGAQASRSTLDGADTILSRAPRPAVLRRRPARPRTPPGSRCGQRVASATVKAASSPSPQAVAALLPLRRRAPHVPRRAASSRSPGAEPPAVPSPSSRPRSPSASTSRASCAPPWPRHACATSRWRRASPRLAQARRHGPPPDRGLNTRSRGGCVTTASAPVPRHHDEVGRRAGRQP